MVRTYAHFLRTAYPHPPLFATFSFLGLSPSQMVHLFSETSSHFRVVLVLAVGDRQDRRGYVALGPSSKISRRGW